MCKGDGRNFGIEGVFFDFRTFYRVRCYYMMYSLIRVGVVLIIELFLLVIYYELFFRYYSERDKRRWGEGCFLLS